VPGKLFFYGRIYFTKAGNFIAAPHDASLARRHMKICPPAEGVYTPEGRFNLRAKSQELRAIFMVDDGGKLKNCETWDIIIL